MSTRKRSGYTILEALLVLAIMVTLFALSWPALRGPLAKARLKQAARDVQTSLGKARARAVEHGAAYAFRYQIDGGEFQILAWDALAAQNSIDGLGEHDLQEDSAQSARDSTRAEDAEGAASIAALVRRPQSLPITTRTLPAGVRFVDEAADPLLDGTSAESEIVDAANSVDINDEGLLEASSIRWSQPIVFWPNGRSQNARVLIRDERDYAISVDLRGLTGIASYGPATRPARVDDELDSQSSEQELADAPTGATGSPRGDDE